MKFYKKIASKISLLLIISILSLNLSFFAAPQRAQATWPTIDAPTIGQWATDIVKWIKDHWWEYAKMALEKIAKAAARQAIMQMTQYTVDWINGKDPLGKPAFISDPGKFFNDAMDEGIGDFIQSNPDLNFLCDPFKFQVSLALQLGYGGGFKDRIGCTLTDINKNIQGAIDNSGVVLNGQTVTNRGMSNFESNGGWMKFLENSTQPQNNPRGAYLISQYELEAQLTQQKTNKTIELAAGDLAIGFKRCYDTYKDAQTGNPVGPEKSAEYTVGAGETLGNRPSPPRGAQWRTEQHCVLRTPGGTIKDMLSAKANSDLAQTTLQTLSDGVDMIFNALMAQMFNKLKEKMKQGQLSDATPADQAYSSTLSGSISQASAEFDAAMQNYNSQDIGAGLGEYMPGYSTPNLPPNPVNPYPSTTTTRVSSSTLGSGSGSGSYSSAGGAFDQAKNNSTILLNSLSTSESAYQTNYLIAQKVLTEGRAVFATSSLCNVNYNRSTSISRSLLIRSNVITNIDGVPDSGRTIANLPWNLPVVNAALAISNAHMEILQTAGSAVSSASTIAAITTAMIPVNSTSFNTDPQSQLVPSIKTWLSGVKRMYDSTICPINLTRVLQINSVGSTTATSTP